MPSKLYCVRAVERPILFLGDPDGAVARDIVVNGMGAVLAPDDAERWARQVEALAGACLAIADGVPPAETAAAAPSALNAWCSALGELVPGGRRRPPAEALARKVV